MVDIGTAAQLARLLQFRNRSGVDRMAIHVDHTWLLSGSMQCQLQKVLGGNQIPVGRQHEIDGVADMDFGVRRRFLSLAGVWCTERLNA